jgi:acetyl-CoA acetyltransferase
MFGLGPVPAVKQALQRAGWDIRSIERAEINEAFAAIAIVVARELGYPRRSSTSKAAPLRTAIQSVPPAQC